MRDNSKLEQKKAKKLADYQIKTKKLNKFFLINLIVFVLFIGFFFLDWIYIYNGASDAKGVIGVEIYNSGFKLLMALFGNGFESENAFYDNLFLFNYYASGPVHVLAVVALIMLIVLIALITINVIGTVKKNHKLFYVNCGLSIALAITTLVGVISVSQASGPMISGYCSGNPNCSLQTFLTLPLIISIIMTGLNFVVLFIDRKHARELK